jgi:hypothetical protein
MTAVRVFTACDGTWRCGAWSEHRRCLLACLQLMHIMRQNRQQQQQQKLLGSRLPLSWTMCSGIRCRGQQPAMRMLGVGGS